MNVTNENFTEVAEEIEALLPTAAFVAFDEEMTGISIPGLDNRMEDTPAKRYAKMRQVASKYKIIQFGMALFHAQPGGDGYVARAYNFYLFPETGAVNMDAASVAFNRTHGMDWNTHGDLGPPRPPCRAARSPPGRSTDVEQSTQNWSGQGERS
jgi:hypothetical protein